MHKPCYFIFVDNIYATKCLTYWSTSRWNKEYVTYSERIQQRWGQYGYELDYLKRVRVGPNSKQIDFKDLYDTLRSNDL